MVANPGGRQITRIALITPGFSAGEKDWSIPWLQNFVQQIATECELTVYPLRYPPQSSPYSFNGVPVYPLGWGQKASLHRWRIYPQFFKLFTSHHRERPYQLIHAFWAEEPGFLATRLGSRLNLPVIVSLVGGELARLEDIRYGSLRGLQTRRLVREAIGNANRIIAPSVSTAQCVTQWMKGVAPRLGKIPLGVRLDLFNPDGSKFNTWSSSEKHLLHVSNLSPVKDPKLLLNAFKIIHSRIGPVRLHILGGEARPADWTRQLEDLGLSGCTSFHGWKPHDELASYYRSADITLMTSRYEGHMNVALEALACGCPVVSTAVGVVPELSPPIRSVTHRDPTSVAEAVLDVLRHSSCRDRLRQSGIEVVRCCYSLETMAQKYLDEYAALF